MKLQKHWRKKCCLLPFLQRAESCKAKVWEVGQRRIEVLEKAQRRQQRPRQVLNLPSLLLQTNIWLELAFCTEEGGATVDMFPHVVTLYNTETVELPENNFEEKTVNYITVLKGVLLDAVKAKNVNESGLVGADSVTLYIPKNVEAVDGVTGEPKEYMGPIEFWRLENKAGKWTLSVGKNTFFIKGEAVHPDWDSQKIDAIYDDVYDVNTVDFKDFGMEMSHWEVGGG